MAAAAALVATGCADPSGAGGTTVGSASASTGAGMETGAGGTLADGGSGGATTDAGAGGAGGDDRTTTSTGSGGADACADQGPGEMNDTMETATELAGGTDCDTLSMNGTIDGPGDIDWYTYTQSDDETLCNVKPGRDWAVASGHTILVCKYVACQEDGMSPDTVNCDNGSTPDEHNGLQGCCHTEPFNVGIGLFGCDGSTDLVDVYTRIEEPDAEPDACTDYNLNYTF
jgi:hypothetical protein